MSSVHVGGPIQQLRRRRAGGLGTVRTARTGKKKCELQGVGGFVRTKQQGRVIATPAMARCCSAGSTHSCRGSAVAAASEQKHATVHRLVREE
jgi:hypothetical protein